MRKIAQYFTEKRCLIVWHPTIPGDKVLVKRNWVQRLVYPSHFATNKEVANYMKTKN